MIFANTIDTFNPDYTFLLERVPNTIIPDGFFTRVIYASPCETSNGIYIMLNLSSLSIEQHYTRSIYIFNPEAVSVHMRQLETIILKKAHVESHKTPDMKLTYQLQSGAIKLMTQENRTGGFTHILLKISGIWESSTQYGLMYKFIPCPR